MTACERKCITRINGIPKTSREASQGGLNMGSFREYIPEGGWYNWNMRRAARERRKRWVKDALSSIGLALVLLVVYSGVGLAETYL